MNCSVFVGRIGADAELRYTPNGAAVCSVNLAVNKGKDKPPLWVKAVLWNKLAESVAQYLTKGTCISVQGETDSEAWIDKSTGDAKSRVTVNVRQFSFAGGSKQANESAEESQEPQRQTTSTQSTAVDDSDIPF